MLPPGLQAAQSQESITYSKLLVVEGQDAFQFFKALLRHENLLDQIEIRNMGGVNDFGQYLRTLVATPGFDSVIAVGIIRDAESNAQTAFDSVCSGLMRAELPIPTEPAAVASGSPATGVFILPDCSDNGMLEDLCLRAVADDRAIWCMERYFRCIEKQTGSVPSNLSKAKVHAFLASRSRPDLRLGQAAHEGYWNWDSPVYEPLKQFLRAL